MQASGVGLTEGERALDRRRYLNTEIARIDGIKNKTQNEYVRGVLARAPTRVAPNLN